MARDQNQLTLSLFDTTSLSSGMTLDGGYRAPATTDRDDEGEDAGLIPVIPAIPARNFVLRGDRTRAHGWKARAADNLKAIRLAIDIDNEKRNATADEQEVLSRFVAFGASDLADKVFRRAGDAIRSLHAGVHRPRDLAGRSALWLCRRLDSRTRLRNRLVLRPDARGARWQNKPYRRRNGRDDRENRQTPLPERLDPA
jgi:hypothetical protein